MQYRKSVILDRLVSTRPTFKESSAPPMLDHLLHGLKTEAKRVAAAEWRRALGPAALTSHAT